MAFFGASFIYDNIPSETFDLRIMNFEQSPIELDSSGKAELITETLPRRNNLYLYGKTQNEPMEFTLTVGSFESIPARNRNYILRWLLGRNQFLPFQIVQDDMMDTIFYVLFTDTQLHFFGNEQKVFTIHGICNAPWGFTPEQTWTQTMNPNIATNKIFRIYNDGIINGYTDLKYSFSSKGAANAAYMSFQNQSDITSRFSNGRTLIFDALPPDKKIDIDTNTQIATMYYYDYVSASWKLDTISPIVYMRDATRWIRLVPGNNILVAYGNLEYFSITYRFTRGV